MSSSSLMLFLIFEASVGSPVDGSAFGFQALELGGCLDISRFHCYVPLYMHTPTALLNWEGHARNTYLHSPPVLLDLLPISPFQSFPFPSFGKLPPLSTRASRSVTDFSSSIFSVSVSVSSVAFPT